MKLLLVALVLVAFVVPAAAQDLPKVQSNSATRSPATVAAFRKLHPCPGGPDAGSAHRCHGYVVDHRWPLCAGGKDETENMQYQTVAEGKDKDRLEWYICKALGTMRGGPTSD